MPKVVWGSQITRGADIISGRIMFLTTTGVVSDAEQTTAHGLGVTPRLYGAYTMSGAVQGTAIVRGADATNIYAKQSLSGGSIAVWAIA
jgi:hypothetical protein